MYPVFFFTIAILGATIHYALTKKKSRARMIEIYLAYLIFCSVGLQGLLAASGHIFMADKVAEQIGWPTGSPFQFEVGVANLGMGVAGVLAPFFRRLYYLATVIIYAIFIYGAAYGHFVQQARGDHSPYNTGIFLWVGDIIIPTIIVILTLLYFTTKSKKK